MSSVLICVESMIVSTWANLVSNSFPRLITSPSSLAVAVPAATTAAPIAAKATVPLLFMPEYPEAAMVSVSLMSLLNLELSPTI